MLSRRMVRKLSLVTCAVVLSACAGGESTDRGTDEPRRGGTLNLLGSGDVDYMDPNLTYYSIGYLAMRPWARQAYTYPAVEEDRTEAVPDLAEALPRLSSDAREVRFTLREGALWNSSPPRQITAKDFIRGVMRTCNPAQPFGGLPDYLDLFVGLKAFCDGFASVGQDAPAIASYMRSHDVAGLREGSNERTVVLRLTRPAEYLPDMLTLPAFSPAPAEYGAYVPGSAALAQHTMASGPYQIDRYEPGKEIVYTRNPAWDPASDPIRKAWVDKIVVSQTVSEESTQQQLEAGTPNADMGFDNFPPAAQLPALLAKRDPKLTLGPIAASFPFLMFNLLSPNNSAAMRQRSFRRALMHGLDRANVVQVLGGPRLSPPLTQILPASLLGGSPEYDLYPHDVSHARRLLQQVNAADVTLRVLYRSGFENDRRVFATMQQDLAEVGVRAEGIPVPINDLITKYLRVRDAAERGAWDVVITGWAADWYGNAALSFLKPLFGGAEAFPPRGSNFAYYDSPTTNRLIARAEAASTQDEAAAAWHEADVQVMRDAVLYPITSPLQPNYRASHVHGAVYVPAIQNYDPTNVWLDAGSDGG